MGEQIYPVSFQEHEHTHSRISSARSQYTRRCYPCDGGCRDFRCWSSPSFC
jgi:hypothetical protein